MTIDEAIAHEREMSEPCSIRCKDDCDCTECRKEHKQLAEWLEELKCYKETKCNKSVYLANKSIDMIDAVNKGYADGYNKAIDDLIAKCENAKFAESDEIALSDIHTGVNSGLSMAIHLAEQLKEGESE